MLDPTRMNLLPYNVLGGQGPTDGFDQAYRWEEWLQSRVENYGPDYDLGVPAVGK